MYIYKDAAASVTERVNDLLGRMSFEQKMDQLTCYVFENAENADFKKEIPNGIGHAGAWAVAENAEMIAEHSYRLQKYMTTETELGIPALIHCEAAAGALFTEASVFPSAISQASSFNSKNVGDMAEIIREELFAVGFRQALSPVVDISRDMRWGRITETYGEDPTLTALMCVNYVKGLQSTDENIIATTKHFVGHGNAEGGINMGRSLVPWRELLEVHCKPFQAAISEADLMSVMNSYACLDGEPVASSKKILTELLREKMGFLGFVVSDYISIDRIVSPFMVAETYEEAGAKALSAGMDVEYPRVKGFTYRMKEAVENGDVSMEEVDTAVRRVLTAKFELGLFENPYPEVKKVKTILHAEKSKKLNKKMAKEGLTLLKNNDVLPLSKEVKKVAVIGPHGDSLRSFFGPFSYPAMLDMMISREEDGLIIEEPGMLVYDIRQRHPGDIRESSPRVERRIREEYPEAKTLYAAVKDKLPCADVQFALGLSSSGTNTSGKEYALGVAANADVVILTLGGKNGWGMTSTVGEGIDSTCIDLPGEQESFAREVFGLGKKTVVVHFDGRPLSNEYVASHFAGIIEAWQPGEYGGEAIADVLFGDYNPAGRLPVTAPRNVGQTPVYHSLPRGSGYIGSGHPGMIRNPYGYINDDAHPLYYFGHGLSYSEFEYSDLKIKKEEIRASDELEISLWVENIGDVDGDEVVQLYISDKVASMVRAEMEFAGCARVHLAAGEKKQLSFRIKATQLAFLDKELQWIVEQGEYRIMVGASAIDIRLSDSFYLTETECIDPKQRGFYAEVE